MSSRNKTQPKQVLPVVLKRTPRSLLYYLLIGLPTLFIVNEFQMARAHTTAYNVLYGLMVLIFLALLVYLPFQIASSTKRIRHHVKAARTAMRNNRQ